MDSFCHIETFRYMLYYCNFVIGKYIRLGREKFIVFVILYGFLFPRSDIFINHKIIIVYRVTKGFCVISPSC